MVIEPLDDHRYCVRSAFTHLGLSVVRRLFVTKWGSCISRERFDQESPNFARTSIPTWCTSGLDMTSLSTFPTLHTVHCWSCWLFSCSAPAMQHSPLSTRQFSSLWCHWFSHGWITEMQCSTAYLPTNTRYRYNTMFVLRYFQQQRPLAPKCGLF